MWLGNYRGDIEESICVSPSLKYQETCTGRGTWPRTLTKRISGTSLGTKWLSMTCLQCLSTWWRCPLFWNNYYEAKHSCTLVSFLGLKFHTLSFAQTHGFEYLHRICRWLVKRSSTTSDTAWGPLATSPPATITPGSPTAPSRMRTYCGQPECFQSPYFTGLWLGMGPTRGCHTYLVLSSPGWPTGWRSSSSSQRLKQQQDHHPSTSLSSCSL